ncbi:MAG: restriction endonuclease [Planctomycetota bacterium]
MASAPSADDRDRESASAAALGVTGWLLSWPALPEQEGPLAAHELRVWMLGDLERRLSLLRSSAARGSGEEGEEVRRIARALRSLCHPVADPLEAGRWPDAGWIAQRFADARERELSHSMPKRWLMAQDDLTVDQAWPLLDPRHRLLDLARWLLADCPEAFERKRRSTVRLHASALEPAEEAVARFGVPVGRVRRAREDLLSLLNAQAPSRELSRAVEALHDEWESLHARLLALKLKHPSVKGAAKEAPPTSARSSQAEAILGAKGARKFPLDRTLLARTLSELIGPAGFEELSREIASAGVEVAGPELDNWNGGTWIWDLVLPVNPRLFLSLGDRPEVEARISELAKALLPGREDVVGGVRLVPRARKDAHPILADTDRLTGLEEVESALLALYADPNPQRRGKALEGVLNRLCEIEGILVREASEVRTPEGALVEQVDGCVAIDGTTYIVEMKWLKEPVGPSDVGLFLARVLGRGDVGGIFVSESDYSPGAVSHVRAALVQKTIVLVRLEEVALLLARRGSLPDLLRRKVEAARLDRNPLLQILE